jgi:hypothetical protein
VGQKQIETIIQKPVLLTQNKTITSKCFSLLLVLVFFRREWERLTLISLAVLQIGSQHHKLLSLPSLSYIFFNLIITKKNKLENFIFVSLKNDFQEGSC